MACPSCWARTCARIPGRTGIATVCLRPVWVWDRPGTAGRGQWRARPRSEWEPYWEYGAFVDVRDVAAAVGQALTVPLAGHHRVLLCAPGIAATAPGLDLAARLAPQVPVTDPGRYRADPWGRPHRLLSRRRLARLAARPPVVTTRLNGAEDSLGLCECLISRVWAEVGAASRAAGCCARILTRPVSPAGIGPRPSVPPSGNYRGTSGLRGNSGQPRRPDPTASRNYRANGTCEADGTSEVAGPGR